MLYGIRPAEQLRLARDRAQVRVYVPYGSDWYGYLVRRLAERPATSRSSCARSRRAGEGGWAGVKGEWGGGWGSR